MIADITVLGAGYAGVAVAREAARLGMSARVVDRRAAHELLTRLPELLSGRVPSGAIGLPLDGILPPSVEHVSASILGIDAGSRTVRTDAGDLRYRYLVIATGALPSILDATGSGETRAFPVRSISQTLALRDALLGALTRQPVVRAVIVGGGYTGTEVAGELAAWSGQEERGRVDVTVLTEDALLLTPDNLALSAAANSSLQRRGVRVFTRMHVVSCDSGLVRTPNVDFPADIVVWATPSRGAAPPGTALPVGASGHVQVDPYLRVDGHEQVFAAGDVIRVFDFVHGRFVPGSAQLAVAEGRLVARNILAAMRGERLREYRPRPIGEAVSLGPDDGVAEVGGVVLRGRQALAVKRLALARYLVHLGMAPSKVFDATRDVS